MRVVEHLFSVQTMFGGHSFIDCMSVPHESEVSSEKQLSEVSRHPSSPAPTYWPFTLALPYSTIISKVFSICKSSLWFSFSL